MAMDEALKELDAEALAEAYAEILRAARAAGFDGFGGRCGHAAIAINRVLFGGEGLLVGGVNSYFRSVGRIVGHICVLHDGLFWDADGRPKEEDDVESWGMLDPEDPDWRALARSLGCKRWTEARAADAEMIEFDSESEVLEHFGDGDGDGAVGRMCAVLADVLEEWRASRAPRLR